ncbi:MAG TPA: hypothetical protein PK036_11720 [Geobacteraceae bacterium]|nr:hypothetical protein [Geobacteraceae bacterium]
MSGLSSLPGLEAHRIVPEEKKPVFDHERAARLVSDAVSLLESLYPQGGMEWLRKFRPDVIDHLKAAEASLDKAIDDGDLDAFTKSLDLYTKSYQRAFEVYSGRPPVIERQEGLFS